MYNPMPYEPGIVPSQSDLSDLVVTPPEIEAMKARGSYAATVTRQAINDNRPKNPDYSMPFAQWVIDAMKQAEQTLRV